jgi:hypothetical protein
MVGGCASGTSCRLIRGVIGIGFVGRLSSLIDRVRSVDGFPKTNWLGSLEFDLR